MSTMLSAAALNGVNADGSAADRNPAGGIDVLLQATQLFGSQNTAGRSTTMAARWWIPRDFFPLPDRSTTRSSATACSAITLREVDRGCRQLRRWRGQVGGTRRHDSNARRVRGVGGPSERPPGRRLPLGAGGPRSLDRGDLVRADVFSATYQALMHAFFTGSTARSGRRREHPQLDRFAALHLLVPGCPQAAVDSPPPGRAREGGSCATHCNSRGTSPAAPPS
jgi:hypothetical protein